MEGGEYFLGETACSCYCFDGGQEFFLVEEGWHGGVFTALMEMTVEVRSENCSEDRRLLEWRRSRLGQDHAAGSWSPRKLNGCSRLYI